MNAKILALNALIAAVYAAQTILLAPLSYGPVQVRLSESMTLLAYVNPRFVPGLVIGCMLANLYSPFGIIDVIVGTFATWLAVYPMRRAPNLFAASLLPVITNGVIIGGELMYLGQLPPELTLLGMMGYIAAGEFIAVSIVGVIAISLMLKNDALRRYLEA